MQVNRIQISPTNVKLSIAADEKFLADTKHQVIQALSANVKVPGFRPGKAPASLVEKNIDQSVLQSEFLDRVVNRLYVDAIAQERLRPVSQPNISVTKFVPFSTLEFTAETEVVGDVKVADYTKIKLKKVPVTVTVKDVDEVIQNLRTRAATKKPVERQAKNGDEVVIDFTGTDATTNQPIAGADGKAYPLLLGSGSFIPGFENELIGAKAGAVTTFTLNFPKDYSATELQNRKVTFAVTVHSVQELAEPKLDDTFAASVGPFKTVAELKADVKKQLTAQKEQEATNAFDNELIEKIAAKSTVVIPDSLVQEEIDRMEEEEKRNIVYRGQTWDEHLAAEGLTAEAHRAQKHDAAERRVKAGLILSEISIKEGITVTPEELEIRLQLLKGQYQDAAMQAELDKPDNRRDIHSRMLTEKTLDKLRAYASS